MAEFERHIGFFEGIIRQLHMLGVEDFPSKGLFE